MASSPPTSEVDELCRFILHAIPEEPAQCWGRRQVPVETDLAEEAAGDWLEEDETVVIEFPDPELDTEKTKKKKHSSGGRRLSTFTTLRGSQLPGRASAGGDTTIGGNQLAGRASSGREMVPSALLPISARRGPFGTPHSVSKRRQNSGSSGCPPKKFKCVRKELPKLSHEDVDSGLPSPTKPLATGQTTADNHAPNTPTSPFSYPPSSHHPSPYSPTLRDIPWSPQAENPELTAHSNVRVTVLAPDNEERLKSKCKVEGNAVCVKPGGWFRLQFESPDLADKETRVSAHYVHNETRQTPLVSCDKCYEKHKEVCNVCGSRDSGDRPFLCSNSAMFSIHPTAQVGAACEVEAPFTPLDSFVSSVDPNKVTLQMNAICLTSCGHHDKRKVTLLVEARQCAGTTNLTHVNKFTFTIRCSMSPARDIKPKYPKSIRNTPFNHPSQSPASHFASPPQHLPGLGPDIPPSACLSPHLLDNSPMLSSAASPSFSHSYEIHQGEFDVMEPLQAPLKYEPCDVLLRPPSHRLQLRHDASTPSLQPAPPASNRTYILEVLAVDEDTLEQYRRVLQDLNIKTSPGHRIHVP